MKWIKILLGWINSIILEGFKEDYEGFIISEDIEVFRIINEFGKYNHLDMEQLAAMFESMGYELPFEARDSGKIDCITIGESEVEFWFRDDWGEVWKKFEGKVEKYRTYPSGETELFEWFYDQKEGVEYHLWCNYDDCTITLQRENQTGVTVKVHFKDKDEFREISSSLAVIILENYYELPLVIHKAIKALCPAAESISVTHEIVRRWEKVTIAKVHSTEEVFNEVTEIYCGAYLRVKAPYCWVYTSLDGKWMLRKNDRSTPILFEGGGERVEAQSFLQIDGIQKEAKRLAKSFNLS